MDEVERISRCLARRSELSGAYQVDVLYHLESQIRENGELNIFQKKALEAIERRLAESAILRKQS